MVHGGFRVQGQAIGFRVFTLLSVGHGGVRVFAGCRVEVQVYGFPAPLHGSWWVHGSGFGVQG